MGKNSRGKKKKSESEGSASTQASTSSGTSGGQAQQGSSGRQRLMEMTREQGDSQSAQRQTSQQPQQRSQQQQGQGRGQPTPQQPQQSQQQAWGPKADKPQQQQQQTPQQKQQGQGQGKGRGQPSAQHPQQQAWGPNAYKPQQQQQQQERPQQQGQGSGRGQPAPQQPSQQQSWGPTQDNRPQAQSRASGQQPQRSAPDMNRSDSVQSVQSTQSGKSAGFGGRPQKPQTDERIPAALLKDLEMLKMGNYKGPGTNGKKLGFVETNYLRLGMNKMAENAYHHDVSFDNDRPKKLLTTAFMKFAQENFPEASIAFDGAKNAYANIPLTETRREVTIMHPETGHERSYTIEIVPARNTEIPIKRLLSNYQNHPHNDDDEQMKRAMQAVEVILKAAFHQDHLHTGIQGGRSFYLPIANRPYLGDFSELWLGLFQSLVLGEVAFLNVDVNHKAFPKRYGSLVDLLRDMRMNIDPSRGIHRDVEFALAKHLGGLEICYNGKGQKRIYKFVEIARKPNDVKFILENGQETSVLQYFQSIGRHIEYPNLPCIRLGNTIKSHIVPMEFCSIPDRQVINKKCTKNQTSAIIKQAATSTDDRKAKIMELIRKISHNQSPVIRGFGMQVGSDFEKVPIRQLEAPKLVYGGNKTVQPQTGVWRGENMQFLMPKTRVQWAILNTNDKTSRIELKELAEKLQQYSVPTGLQLAAKPVTIQSYGETHKIEAFLHKVGQGQQIHIVFVVIPASGSNYSKIKQMAEINYGVLTQCIKSGTVLRKRKESSTISNILLKVNAKLNGTNHKLQASPILTAAPGKVMVIGADVTHPSPEQRSIPSIVGVAASHDHNAFCYNMCWRLQAPKLEIIQDFKEICKNHLKIFKQKNGAFPEKILYYRDGVSEGQFDEVMAVEKRAMSEACREVEQGYDKKVKITVVVVQKRHHTRLFPGQVGAKISDDFQKKESKTGPTRPGNNNVPAGTVVDTVIIRPMENNFFLVSHQSIQGVAKPTKYCILLDQANYSTNDLQSLTFNLCHMFARCNRSVSYPAPTYYAHLVAARGKVYIENARLDMNNLEKEYRDRAIKENIISRHPMYFI